MHSSTFINIMQYKIMK